MVVFPLSRSFLEMKLAVLFKRETEKEEDRMQEIEMSFMLQVFLASYQLTSSNLSCQGIKMRNNFKHMRQVHVPLVSKHSIYRK